MKKRSKVLAALTASVMAFTAVCVGFSQWSSDISLNGSVSASGKWDVEITNAALQVSSAGATAANVEATAEVVVYDVVLGENTDSASDTINYYMAIDDTDPQTITVNAEEFAEYSVKYTTTKGYTRYSISGNKADKVLYYVNLNDAGEALAAANLLKYTYGTVNISSATAAGYEEGTVIGQAIAASIGGSYTGTPSNNPNITLTWKTASDTLASAEEAQVRYTATTATYGAVDFSLPGAWANYSVTITNNGTVNANLSEYKFDFTALDEDIYSVDVPEGFEDEVLAPGESCAFNFVVQVEDTLTDLTSESESFEVTLHYVQDTVEEAPTAAHTNSTGE